MRQPERRRALREAALAALSVAHGRVRCRGVLAVGVAVVATLAASVGGRPLKAQEDEAAAASREHRIKAAYLYQFGRYVEWPAKAFANPQSPFVIAVPQSDPIVADLEQVAKNRKIQDRPIRIRKFSSPSDVPACHILYLPSSLSLAPGVQAEIIRRMGGNGTLVVGDSQALAAWGGIVGFAVEDNKVRIYIARKAAEREGLTISAKLLQVASVVD